jgi:hypothetical protein
MGVAVVGAGVSALNADRRVRLKRVADEDVVEWVDKARDGRCVPVVHNLLSR